MGEHKTGAAASLVVTGHIHIKGRARGPRMKGAKRHAYEHTSGDQFSDDLQRWTLIDRENDYYREKISDPESGQIIHFTRVP
jgi:hypothetical protein